MPTDFQGDFFDHSEDQIAKVEDLLDAIEPGKSNVDTADALGALKRIAHCLKGGRVAFEVPSVSVVAAQLDDFMVGLKTPTPQDARKLRHYFGQLGEFVERRRDVTSPELASHLARLSKRRPGIKN